MSSAVLQPFGPPSRLPFSSPKLAKSSGNRLRTETGNLDEDQGRITACGRADRIFTGCFDPVSSRSQIRICSRTPQVNLRSSSRTACEVRSSALRVANQHPLWSHFCLRRDHPPPILAYNVYAL
ncbi:uncharacterized protein FOMMEDRAFT_167912 [Fomitiporia mediterranea MF3/22]|uniref:uncharacterized protein n=1 Tax=Fomitiporia mediterranea (strain MF3/22) TaxID=694068 RepID=UPI0004409A34|nr:uncharacterized protein FOMMEDRAFT_167912 [Fomitiporia mediterranea MF3/22]EJD02740.1 hypothetical protein FOMMEDRAFT_167912 [Fomitiporia mediterranea MF3/22]